eukprot:jgi/Mesen1/950/ME000118S00125
MSTSRGHASRYFSVLMLVFVGSASLREVAAQSPADLACQPVVGEPPCKFVDAFRQPSVIDGSTGAAITIGAHAITQKMHRDLPPTKLYAYGTSQETASYPGPIIEAQRGTPTTVTWVNNITDANHFLTVDRTLNWANPEHGGVPTVTHLHGGEAPSHVDGHPFAWITAKGDKGPTFFNNTYVYPNWQEPTLLWYHDHAMGMTRLNVLSGLAGFYVLRSKSMESSKAIRRLPAGPYEKLLMLQDHSYDRNGTLHHGNVGDVPDVHPHWLPEYFGNHILVNGVAWPYLNVEPRRYRIRIVNGANARFFNLSLSTGMGFWQIGADGGYLPRPVAIRSILVAPAERVDLVLDFTGAAAGSEIVVQNTANFPFPDGDSVDGNTNVVMKFLVNQPLQGRDMSQLPSRIRRTYKLMRNRPWRSAVVATDVAPSVSEQGATEIWRIINLSEDAHPIHLHIAHFQILNRIPLDRDGYVSKNCSITRADIPSCYTGRPVNPEENESGWKDTAVTYPGQVTSLIVRFATQAGKPYPFNVSEGPGYVWHCHIFDHEDNEMMRPLFVFRK